MKLKGGLALEAKKESQHIQWTIKRFRALPKKVWIPLHINKQIAARPCVEVGSRVCIGEKIGTPANDKGVAIYASISGQVSAIDYSSHPLMGESQMIEVESDEAETLFPGVGEKRPRWESLPVDDLYEIFKNYGLVDMRLPGEALHSKLNRARKKFVSTLVINACETEPYVSCDYSLVMSHPVEVLQGAEILRRAVGAEKIVIAMGENEREAVELLKSKVFFLKWNHCHIEMVSSLHPQSEDSILLQTLSSRNIPGRVAPPLSLALNTATAFATYEAVAKNKPFYERALTIDGECLMDSRNMWIPAGMHLSHIVKACRGFLREPRKVIMGGPMSGIAQTTLEVPILPMTQALLALPKEVAKPEEVEPCIRCGDCLDVCPSEISPVMITLAAQKDAFLIAKENGVDACVECGNCAYVCPSKRPMIDLIHYAMMGAAST